MSTRNNPHYFCPVLAAITLSFALGWTSQASAAYISGVTIYEVSSELTTENSGYDRSTRYVIDGSGLDSSGQHTDNPDGYMWDANTFGPSLVSGGATDVAPTITFDLGAAYDLTGLTVWNYNHGNYIGRGVKDMEIAISQDGSAYTSLGMFYIAQATGLSDYSGVQIALAGIARYVKFDILSNQSADLTYGVGLSEVKFSGNSVSAVPVPAAVWLVSPAVALLGLFGKRRSKIAV